jgi:hypothetical protein
VIFVLNFINFDRMAYGLCQGNRQDGGLETRQVIPTLLFIPKRQINDWAFFDFGLF